MRALGYVRISKMDEGTTSPQRQRAAIQKWCRDRGAELLQTFEDLDLSAYDKRVRRPGFERMLGRLDEVDTIVTWRLDRLARSVSGFAKLLDRLEEAGVKVATTDGQVDMTTAAGRAMVQMTAVFAELEAGTTSERARQMLAYKRSKGEWIGRTPRGFRRNGKGLEVDEEKFAVIEVAASRYVAGESLRQISRDVGIPHPNLSKMLRSEHVLEALPHSLSGPLAQALAERGRAGTPAKRSLLGGIARCMECTAGLTIVGRQPNGWAAYSCRKCGHVAIAQGWLDDHVSAAVLDAIDTGQLLDRLKKRRKRRSPGLASREIEAKLELLEVDFYERAMMPRDRYLRRREGLLGKLAKTREAEQHAGIDLPRELAANLAERWPELLLSARRAIIVAVLERIDVAKANGHGKIDPGRVRLVWRA